MLILSVTIAFLLLGVLWLAVLLVITIISNRLSARSATDYQ